MPRLYSANLGTGGGSGVLVVRSGQSAIGNGVNQVVITFSSPLSSTSYAVNFTIDNETDVDPIFMQGLVIDKQLVGFTVQLVAPTDSANYELSYMVCEFV